MVERQELYCHNCDRYVQFNMDLSINGNHVLTCPNCGHEHCRVVQDGLITGDRWDSRNPVLVPVASATWTIASSYSTYTNAASGNSFLYSSWLNSAAATW